MTRRARGWLLTAAGIVLVAGGLLIPPAPWVLLWAPGILAIVAGYGYITGPERLERRPGYINDPRKKDRWNR